MAFGVCASTGGFYQNYSTMPGADQVVPVDVYIPGCPPRPEQVLDGLILLQERIQRGEGHSQITHRGGARLADALAAADHGDVSSWPGQVLDAVEGEVMAQAVARTARRRSHGDEVASIKREPCAVDEVAARTIAATGVRCRRRSRRCIDRLDWNAARRTAVARRVPRDRKWTDDRGPASTSCYTATLVEHASTACASKCGVPRTIRSCRLAGSALWRAPTGSSARRTTCTACSFAGHPDLRRILMYPEFVGHPLRKDYPKEKRQPLVRRRSGEVTTRGSDSGRAHRNGSADDPPTW